MEAVLDSAVAILEVEVEVCFCVNCYRTDLFNLGGGFGDMIGGLLGGGGNRSGGAGFGGSSSGGNSGGGGFNMNDIAGITFLNTFNRYIQSNSFKNCLLTCRIIILTF